MSTARIGKALGRARQTMLRPAHPRPCQSSASGAPVTLLLLILLVAVVAIGVVGCTLADESASITGDIPTTTGPATPTTGPAATTSSATPPDFFIARDVAAPMRDGVTLRANVYRPAEAGRYPVLVFRTPYSKDEGDPDNERTFRAAVKRGYAVVVQDVRGRYASEGEFVPYQNEGKDGYDTIEWAAAQPWSDGNVGTFGLSYPGAVQWLAAVESPPHLKAMVPAMCFSTVRQFFYFGGVFELDWINWVYRWMAPDTRTRKNLPGAKTIEEAEAEFKRLGADYFHGYLPTLDLPDLKDAAPYYYDWLRHSPYDSWWDWGDLAGKYGRVQAAVLNLSGWYDEPYGPQGATANYQSLLATRASQADRRTHLLIGPWPHGVASTALPEAGDRTFAADAAIDYDQVVLDWLDHYLRGIDNGVDRAKPVRVFLMGEDTWLEADTWPLPDTLTREYYLAPPPNATSAAPQTTGLLDPIPATTPGSASHFTADPSDPVRDDDGTNFGAYDLRALADRPDVLTFETPPLTADLRIMGNIQAEIYLSSDAPDNDLFAIVLDVAPDGTAYNLMSPGLEALRVSYRDQTIERKLLQPGQVVKLAFPNLFTGNTLKAGHRLRLCLTASWFPIYSRNPQTGELETESAATRKATLTIHHNPEHPSRLILPILP